MSYWLITWKWTHDRDKVENEVAAILNYRLSGKTVLKIVDALYAYKLYTIRERLKYAKNNKKNPYPAQFDRVDGVPIQDKIYCGLGQSPYLYARLVDDLRVHVNESGKETLTWKERPKPTPMR